MRSGITPSAQSSIVWTSYAEATLGVRVFGVASETRVDVPLKRRGAGLFPDIPVVKAWVPSHHAVFVEAGGLTGFTSLKLCGQNCTSDEQDLLADGTQLVMPVGGVRYVYGFDLKSKRRHARARFLFELYAQVLGPPFNAPDGERYFPNRTSAGEAGVGGKLGVRTSPFGACLAAILFGFGCLDGGLALGYAPYPRAPIFEFQVGGFIY
jgi:hypothetical protein